MMMEELNEHEIAALIAVRKKLADGVIEFTTNNDDYYFTKGKHNFLNMNIIATEYRCGTVACIGGWMFIELGRKIYSDTLYKFAAERPGFFALCYGDFVMNGHKFSQTTPAQAVQAIDHYMFPEPGKAIWRHLLTP